MLGVPQVEVAGTSDLGRIFPLAVCLDGTEAAQGFPGWFVNTDGRVPRLKSH
jgi:hypothetical protein